MDGWISLYDLFEACVYADSFVVKSGSSSMALKGKTDRCKPVTATVLRLPILCESASESMHIYTINLCTYITHSCDLVFHGLNNIKKTVHLSQNTIII